MSERINDLIQSVEKDSDSSPEQKEKAKQVLEILTKKSKDTLKMNADAHKEIHAILKETSLDATISAELIESNLSIEDNLSDNVNEEKPTLSTGKTSSKKDTTSESDTDSETNGDKMAEKFEREGWDKAYIAAKMYSLGYVPAHSMNWHKYDGKKIQWVWENTKFLAVGGGLTKGELKEGVYETRMTKMNDTVKKWFAGVAIGEETQLRALLKATITAGDNTGDRSKIAQKLTVLNNLKTAINAGNVSAIKIASAEYASISEKMGKTINFLKDKEVNKKIKSQLSEDKAKNEEKARKKIEKSIEGEKDIILSEFDKQIKAEQGKIDTARDTTSLQKDLDTLKNDKVIIENDKVLLNSNKEKLEGEYKRFSDEIKAEGNKKPQNPSEITRLQGELSRLRGEISTIETNIIGKGVETRTKQQDIYKKEIEIRDFPQKNKSIIDAAIEKKEFLEKLKTNTESGNHEAAKKLLKQYERVSGSKFELVSGAKYERFMKTDQTKRLAELIKSELTPKQGVTDATGKYIPSQEQKDYKKERTEVKNKTIIAAIDNEIASKTKEIKEIEKRIEDIKKEAVNKLKELDDKARRQPNEVPKLRGEIVGVVDKMNVEIKLLEAKGVSGLKKLNADELRLLTTQSGWAEKVIKTNGGLDKFMSGKAGKVVGVGAIALLTKGVLDGSEEAGLLSKETGLAVTDISIGMIPVLGGAYDLYMAQIKGTDLNGNKIEGSEKWIRTGFGIIGLVPGVGTLVKMAVIAKKGGDLVKVTRAVQKTDAVIETTQFTGKVAGIGLLGFYGVSTVTYTIDEMGKKLK